ncbi:MAG: restriction endonuclease subunit S, partial [Gammaproteobacteria bacterium]|nr:restriction endonuclease subunit S [Gammaproteobacteria bacterium]
MTRPYPCYRDSGVEWLGEVPEHWEVQRLKYVASYRTSSVDKKTEDGELAVRLCNYTDVYYRDRIRAGDNNFMEATASPHELDRFRLLVGDTLITKDSEDWQDIAVPALMDETADDFVCGYHLGIIRPGPAADPTFLFRTMQSGAVNRQLQTSASGVTRYGVPNGAVGSAILPLPPLDEQRAIAAYLDRETERIDALVAKKRSLLERLAEYRTALITRTVTRGLDPSVAMKDSGVEWLGEIPAHWEIGRISGVARSSPGSFTDGDWVELPYITDSGVRLIQTGNVGIGAYREQGFRYIEEASFDELRCTEVNPGDVLICRLADPVGRACLAPDLGVQMITSVDVCILKPSEQFSAEYLVLLLSSKRYLDYVESLVRGGTRDRISRSMLGAIKIPAPPEPEQRVI